MNYKENYFNLINYAKNRKETKLSEIHHILPKSLGGTDDEDNLVKLTPREHFIAHYLLWKFTDGSAHKKMARAFWVMSRKRTISSKCYQKLREEIAKKVICLQTMKIFNSVNEAIYWLKENTSKNLSVIKKNINLVLNNKRKSIYGYSFKYYIDGQKYSKEEMINNKQFSDNAKKVICLQTLQVFENARKAEKQFKISYKNISSSCRFKRSTKGYDFRFYNENKKYKKENKKPIHIQENKKIICNETGEIFNSLSELSKILNTDRKNLKRYITSKKAFKNYTYSFLKVN